MTNLMPLKRAVVEITNEAAPDDRQGIRRAIKSWHNRLASGSIPRALVTKLGRELFLNLNAWEEWLARRSETRGSRGPGRPRTE